MAPRRHSKDDQATRSRSSMKPLQGKRASSVPTNGSRKPLHDHVSQSFYQSTLCTHCSACGTSASTSRVHESQYTNQRQPSTDLRSTTKNTKPLIGKKRKEEGRSKRNQGKLEMELSKMMADITLKENEKGEGQVEGWEDVNIIEVSNSKGKEQEKEGLDYKMAAKFKTARI